MADQLPPPETSEYDEFCRRLGAIFGDGLATRITNEEYRVKRNMTPDDSTLRALERAMTLHESEASR